MAHWVDIAIDIKEIWFDCWVWGHPFSVTGLVRKLLNITVVQLSQPSQLHPSQRAYVICFSSLKMIKCLCHCSVEKHRKSLVMMIFGMMSKRSVWHDKVRSELGAEPIVTKAILSSVTSTHWSYKCLGIVITVGSLIIYTTSRGRLN